MPHKPSYQELEQRIYDLERENAALKHADASMDNIECFHNVLDKIPVMLHSIDRNRVIRSVSDFWLKKLGYTKEEVIGHELTEFYTTASRELAEHKTLPEFFAKGFSENLPYQIVRKDGTVLDVLLSSIALTDARGDFERSLAIMTDITELKQTEQALRESERRLSTLMANLPGMAYRCFNDPGWTMEYISSGCFDLTGYRPWELMWNTRKSFAELIHAEDRDEVWAQVQYALEEQRSFELEYRIMTADGTQKHVWEKGIGVYDQEHLVFLEGLVCDITERKQAEEERENLRNQLLQAQKMESIGRLAGGMAHDLNNMFVAILGYGNMLLADTRLDAKQRRSAELMYEAGLRSRDLVRQLLAFSRRQTLKMESLNINLVISDFQDLLQKTIRENISIQYRLAPRLPTVKADRGQIEQVVLNLAVNAQDAMPRGGVLSIETQEVELDEGYAAQHLSVAPGRYVLLSVADNGQGMDAETQKSIFDPFFTTKKTGEGTGLGLSTVYGIVKQHQGDIWVYSEPDQGATFKVYLPAAGWLHVSQDKPVREKRNGEHARGHETVLVVEDNDMVRELTESVLQDQGYKVVCAANGTQCLQLLQTVTDPIDLLLVDVIMPDINGKALYELVVQSFPQVKVLYMSGYPENYICDQGMLDPDVAFLQKPFSVQDLTAKVREVLDT